MKLERGWYDSMEVVYKPEMEKLRKDAERLDWLEGKPNGGGLTRAEIDKAMARQAVKLGGTPALATIASPQKPLNPVGSDYDLTEARDLKEQT